MSLNSTSWVSGVFPFGLLAIGLALALAVTVIRWRSSRRRRLFVVSGVVVAGAIAVTLITQELGHFPVVSAKGTSAQSHQLTPEQLDIARRAGNGVLPTSGFTVQVSIPGTVSGFHARDAFVWLPPAWVTNQRRKFPVLLLLHGVPGKPADWGKDGPAAQIANAYAAAHRGFAPIIVMPDTNGSDDGDPECVDSSRGNVETYLTVDVLRFAQDKYGASTKLGEAGIAGLSAGGTCALMMALRHPDLFRTFADYSGLTSPTVSENVDPDATIEELFDGSSAAYDAHDPLSLLDGKKYPTLAGWFEVGTDDEESFGAQRTVVPLARGANIQTCAVEIPGGHDFETWSAALQASLPWLSSRLGLISRADPAMCPTSAGS